MKATKQKLTGIQDGKKIDIYFGDIVEFRPNYTSSEKSANGNKIKGLMNY